MPARIGDTRTPAQKEEDSKKAVYSLLSEEFQSWGALKRAAIQKGISTATLSKHLKKFAKIGLVLKKEEEKEGLRLPRTYYRLTSTSERDLVSLIERAREEAPKIRFSNEEEEAWSHMKSVLEIFSYFLVVSLNHACKSVRLEQAKQYMETMLDVRLKDSIRHLVEIFYKYREFNAHYKDYDIPIASLVEEGFLNIAEEGATSWIPEDLMTQYGVYLPLPGITIGWELLSSRSREEALRKITEEIEQIQS